MSDGIREFSKDTPPPKVCYGVLKPEGTFPIDQPLIRSLAVTYIESQIQLAAFKRFECPDTAARMAAANFEFQQQAAKVAADYALAALASEKEREEHAEI